MKKRAKSLLVYGVLALILVIASVFVANAVISYQQGDSSLAISYNLVTEEKAGRVYTPQCFTDCHLPFCFTPSSDSASSIPVTKDDITQTLDFAQGSDQSILKEVGVDYLTTETYTVDIPVYGTCQGIQFSNETGKDEPFTYECVTGSTQEQKTREVWKPLKDISQLNLESGKEQCFDIWGKLKPQVKSNFAVDIIPHLNLQNKEFILAEYAWWNQSGTTYRRNHTGNYTYSSVTKNMPCLINSSWGFGDGSFNNTVWGKCDYSNTALYYNNMSDFYVVNDSGDVQLAMETEGRSGTKYNYNPINVWDGFTVVILPNESISNSTSKVIPSGKVNDEIRFTDTVGSGWGTAASGRINITQGYIRNALHFTSNGSVSARLNPSPSIYNCTNCTFEFIVKKANDVSADNILFFWRTSGGTNVFGEITLGDLNFRSGGNDCIYTGADLLDEKWYYLVFTTNANANRSIYLNGNLTQTCTTGPANAVDIGSAFCIGSNCWDGNSALNSTVDMVRFSNVTRSSEWIQAQYQTMFLNYSRLSAQEGQANPNSTTEVQGDTAILDGIALSTINASYTNYSDLQIYSRNVTGNQAKGKFDVVAVSGNQRWAFNYISAADNTSNYTKMVNITPVLYVWEATNKTPAQITSAVTAFINSTKQ